MGDKELPQDILDSANKYTTGAADELSVAIIELANSDAVYVLDNVSPAFAVIEFGAENKKITFRLKDGGDVLQFEENGDIFVQGRKTTNDKEVIVALRTFLNLQPEPAKPTGSVIEVANRIRTEFEKYKNSESIDWAEMAAHKIVAAANLPVVNQTLSITDKLLQAITYGFKYHRDSMNDNIDVPDGNKLQWILGTFIPPDQHAKWIEDYEKTKTHREQKGEIT